MVGTDNLACTYCIHHLRACVNRIRMLLPTHSESCMYQTIRCPNSDHITNCHHCHTSNPIPNNIKNWNVDGKFTLRKLNYRRPVYIFTQYLISHTFPIHCEHCYILRLNSVIYCVWTLLYIASERCYILRMNAVIYCVWALLYIASEHCYILRLNTYILRLNTVIYCVWTLLYIASEQCYILRLNTVIHCVWTLLYIASEHCYILSLNTVIYCIWTLLYIASEHCYILRLNTYILLLNTYILSLNTVIYWVWTLLYIASEHCYILRLNTVIYCVWTLLYSASEHCYILCLKKLGKQTIFYINTHFTIRTTYVEFQTSTTIMKLSSIYGNENLKKTVQAVQFPLSYW